MMSPVLKWLASPDIDIESFHPEEGAPWGFLLQIGVAPPGVEAPDSFDVTVCSPEWIAAHYGADAIVDGRFHLIVSAYSRRALDDYLDRRLLSCSAPSWGEVVEAIGRFAEYSS